MNFLKKLDLGDRGYPLFFRFLLTVKPVRVRNVLRLTLPNLWEPWKKTLNSFISQQRGNMVEQRECLIDFIFMYYCYIWPSKGFFSLRCFFFQNLAASCACRSRGHWKPHCVVISYSTEFARRSGSQNVWWRRIAHVRIVDGLCEPFFFLILFIYFPINGAERYNDAKTSLECGMNPQMHGTTPSLKRLWVDIYQPTFGIFVILRSDFLFLLLIHLPDKKSLYIWHLLLVAVGNVSHAVN